MVTTQSDGIRDFCINHYVVPARASSKSAVCIRAGDVHEALDLSQRMPQVCAVLGSNRFEAEAKAKRIAVDGPINGANALFVYRLQ